MSSLVNFDVGTVVKGVSEVLVEMVVPAEKAVKALVVV